MVLFLLANGYILLTKNKFFVFYGLKIIVKLTIAILDGLKIRKFDEVTFTNIENYFVYL
jgi:hypothetical protein